MNQNEIVFYCSGTVSEFEVRIENETVWLNLNQLSLLFKRDKSVISRHISNVFKENELDKASTVAYFATVQIENGRSILRKIEYYNLDVIISVGYRVKSREGTQFRIWANKILNEYLLRGYAINNRIEKLENRVLKNEEHIDFFINKSIPPLEGIFFDGQFYDAYTFVCRLIRSAKTDILLFDNYIDESVFTILDKRQNGVSCSIYTQINEQIKLDLIKHNKQYPPICVNSLSNLHDRFLCIDDDLYCIGASIKDLGKKLFSFSKMEMKPKELLSILIKKN